MAALAHQTESIMTPPVTALPVEQPPAFLGVAKSATGKLWRDRLDARGAAKALAIVQRHQLPEMVARELAGRRREPDPAEGFLEPALPPLIPHSYTLTPIVTAAQPAAQGASPGGNGAIF